MEWLNIHSSTLDSPEMVGAEPTDRATWLYLLRFCVGQENAGIIRACGAWGDRRWQQSVRVTLREVHRPSELWTWEGDDLHVRFYPAEKERLVRSKREAGRKGGQATTEAKAEASRANGAQHTQANTQAESQANTQAQPKQEPSNNPTEGEGKGRGSGKIREMEEQGEGAALDAQPVMPGFAPASLLMRDLDPVQDPVHVTFPTAGDPAAWSFCESFRAELARLYPDVDVMREVDKARTKIERGAVAKKTARGMPKFLMGWMERTQNSARPSAAPRERGKYADSF